MEAENKTNFSKSYSQIQTPSDLQIFMANNIQYGFVDCNGNKYLKNDKNYEKNWSEKYRLQSADELLKTLCGICWDQVELERKWFTEHGYEFKTIFLGFKISKPNNYPTHAFLAYYENGRWYWFENSFSDFSGIHEYDDFNKLFNDVVLKYLQAAIAEDVATKKDKNLVSSYDYKEAKSGLSPSEYVSFITGNLY